MASLVSLRLQIPEGASVAQSVVYREEETELGLPVNEVYGKAT